MKKIIFIIGAILVFSTVDAQIVIDSKFKAQTYDEMLAPLIMMQRFHQECLDKLDAMAAYTEQAEQFISKDKDPATWKQYADCYNSIIAAYNSIIDNGTNQGTRKRIADLKRRSTSIVNAIQTAYNRRNRLSNEQYAKLRAVDDIICDRFFSDISIDEFINGKTPVVNYKKRSSINVSNK